MRIRDYILVAILLAVLCVGLYALVPAYTRHRETRMTILRLQESLTRQEQELRDLRDELTALQTDYRAIERVAREKFGLCREGEVIYHVEPGRGPTPAEAPGSDSVPPTP